MLRAGCCAVRPTTITWSSTCFNKSLAKYPRNTQRGSRFPNLFRIKEHLKLAPPPRIPARQHPEAKEYAPRMICGLAGLATNRNHGTQSPFQVTCISHDRRNFLFSDKIRLLSGSAVSAHPPQSPPLWTYVLASVNLPTRGYLPRFLLAKLCPVAS